MALAITQALADKAVEMSLDKASMYTNDAIAATGATPKQITFDSYVDGELSTGASNVITAGRTGKARIRFSGSCESSGNVELNFEIYIAEAGTGNVIRRDIGTNTAGSFCLEADIDVTSAETIGMWFFLGGVGTSTITFNNAQCSLEWIA